MSILSARDRAMVSLGAALGSHCVPCLEHHVPAARRAGMTDEEISLALELATSIQQVPADRAVARAKELAADDAPAGASGCTPPAAGTSGCC